MISPIIAAQNSTPIANIQQNTDGQTVMVNQTAVRQFEEEQRQVRETVIKKDEAVFYEQKHDAKEEGKNKYANLYTNKKRKRDTEENKPENQINRINFDIKI